MSAMTLRAAPPPALAPFHHARPAADRRRGLERVLVLCRFAGRRAAPTPGARRRRNPAGSMIAPNARWPASVPPRSPLRRRQRVADVADRRQAATQAPITAKLGEILVVAQIYDPKLLIAEFTAPATISDRGGQPSMVANWRTARSSVVGLPAVPQRVSLVFDDPAIDRVNGSAQTPLARAKHVELHGRLAEGSPSDHPVIETVLQIDGGSVQERASAAGAAVRCRRAHPAERSEGFLAKAVAGAVSRNPGRRRPCRDRAVADPAGRSGRGCRRHARPQRRRAVSTANCR